MVQYILVNTDRVCNQFIMHDKYIYDGKYIFMKISLVTYRKLLIMQTPNQTFCTSYTLYNVSRLALSSHVERSSISWSFDFNINKLIKMINGNIKKGYNIGLWNCRKGLLNNNKTQSTKMIEVKQFLSDKHLHLLCLVESDLHGDISRIKKQYPLSQNEVHEVLHIPGYQIILPESWQYFGQARILIFAKDNLVVKMCKIGLQNRDLPTVSLEIGFGMEKRTIVNFFYREFTSGVSGICDIQSQVDRLKRQISIWKSLCQGTKDFICLGDANLCAFKWSDEDYHLSNLSSMVHDFMLNTACTQLVNKYTRSEVVRGGIISKSCIDHCYTNVPDKVSSPEVLVVGNSDHYGIVVRKHTKASKFKPNTVMKRSYKNFIVEYFLTDILESNMDAEITACKDLQHAANLFEKKFREILDIHAPIKVFQMRKNYSPFLSEETKLLIEERKVLKEEMTKHCDITLAKEIKLISKKITKLVQTDKQTYYEYGLGNKVTSSSAWKTANELLNNFKNLAPSSVKVSRNGNNELVTNPRTLATLFNGFFHEKVQKLIKTTDQSPQMCPLIRLNNWLKKRDEPVPKFSLKPIDRKMFRQIMKKFKGSRVHGVDWIDAYSLKVASPIIEDSLLHLVNLSLKQSKFATNWKPQLILPLHKKNEKDRLENYRPVSHLVQIGKICEYAVNVQIIEHFTKYNLFHQNHHGSLANHSTATALIQLFDSWLEAAERQELSAVCLLDQSAAYDLLSHDILQDKLKLYNFDESSVNWIMSYLQDRTQSVQVESKSSDYISIGNHGVPQGSVLGGLLHLINSNDFPDCHLEGNSVVYVDDDTDVVHESDPENLQSLIQQESGNSAQWLSDNRLCVAGEKSKLLVIGTKQLKRQKCSQEMSITINGKLIHESSSEKLLGLVVNNELTWKSHLYGDQNNEGLISKLSKRVGILKHLSKYMSRSRLKEFASAMFYSTLSYCLPVFGHVFGLNEYKEKNSRYTSFTMSDNRKLQVLQNSVNRILTGAGRETSTSSLLEMTDSLSIQQMIAYQTILMTQKILLSRKPVYIANRIFERDKSVNLRSRRLVNQPKCKLCLKSEGFVARGQSLMNKLDEKVRDKTSLPAFKLALKSWVKNNVSVKPVQHVLRN